MTKEAKAELKKAEVKLEKLENDKSNILANKMYENAFEWRFEFPEVLDDNGDYLGFDAIIGNPPYIQLQKIGQASTDLEQMNYSTYAKTGDIYSLFYELGCNILKPDGTLTFITSNKWMRAGYGESLRKFFAEKTNPLILIDFAGNQIFDSATVDTNILMFNKAKNQEKTIACLVKEKVLNNLSVFVSQNSAEASFMKSESWTILTPIEQRIKAKMEAAGTPLKYWDINMNYGIKTGYNEAFIIDGKKKDELIAQDPKSGEIIRPILRGRDIKRYSYDYADLWLINTHNGIKEQNTKPINIEDYPAVKQHLDKYYPELEKRADKGATPYNLRNCAYMEDFSKQKIVWAEIARTGNAFTFDSLGYMVGNTGYILVINENEKGLKEYETLLAFLNSKAILFYLDIISTRLDETGWRWLRQYVDLLPVPKLSESQQKVIGAEIQNELDHPTSLGQTKINDLVNQFYGLNEDEILHLKKLHQRPI